MKLLNYLFKEKYLKTNNRRDYEGRFAHTHKIFWNW